MRGKRVPKGMWPYFFLQSNFLSQLFNDFKAWLSDKEFSYANPLQKQIEKLKIVAEETGKLEKIQRQLSPLEEAVKNNREQDIEESKEEIRHLLKEEFVLRAMLEQGQIEAAYQFDKDIDKALEVLADKVLYEQTLAGTGN